MADNGKRTGLGGDVAVERGTEFRARAPGGYRRILVEQVLHDQGAPYALAREIPSAPCTHGALAALAGGTCPVCPAPVARGASFRVQLTHAAEAWRMPGWYEPVS